jgi:hypothetical protein
MSAVMSEDAIQRAVFQNLKQRSRPGVFAFAVPNGGLRSKREAARMQSLGTIAGVPDICVVVAGEAKFLELKTEKGRLSDKQIATRDRLEAAGAQVAVTYGLDEALEALEGWGVFARVSGPRSIGELAREAVSKCYAKREERA